MQAPTYAIPAAQAHVDERAAFIARTYFHLAGAIVLFVAAEVFLFTSGIAEQIAGAMSRNWIFVLGGFMLVSWLATRAAHTSMSKPMQYLALGSFVLMEALIFVPLLYIANTYAPGTIESAAMLTLIGFTGLTAIAFFTRKDFSFLGGMLRWAFIVAIVAIFGGMIFGFHLGMWFSVAMVGLAGAAILYDTSNILHHYPTDRHVAASLQLFASVALMFYYILTILNSRD